MPNADIIPIIDLAPFLANAEGARDQLSTRLRQVQEDIGFYYLINHGVSARLIARALDQVRQFHKLPLADKMKLKVDERSIGYVPFKSSIYVTSPLNKNTKRDLNANFRLVRERPLDHPSIIAKRRFIGPNKWPDEQLLPDFKPTMLSYYQAMEDLGRTLLPLYALALGLADDYFTPFFTDPTWMTRNVHYPVSEAEENQFGAAPHRDHSFLTLLPISDVPALEVQTQNGEWISADYVENAILVNSGEFMSKWTNGRFIATPHRVKAPKRERHIIAFFFNPTWDVVANPLPGCVDADHPPQFEPEQFLDHLCNYIDGNYTGSSGGKLDDSEFS